MTAGSLCPVLRKTESRDLSALKKLWIDSFHDLPEATELFFERNKNTMHGYCADADGHILSALYLLPCTLNGMPAHYLCGAATERAYRGNGVMRALIAFALDDARRRGDRFSVLYPANEGLYGFYAALGYEPRCKVRTVTWNRADSGKPCDGPPDFERLQIEGFHDNFLLWNQNFLSFAAAYYACYGVKTLSSRRALAIVEDNGDTAQVLYCVYNSEKELKNLLFHHLNANRFVLSGKAELSLFADGREEDGGMLCRLDETAPMPDNVYIGITLN